MLERATEDLYRAVAVEEHCSPDTRNGKTSDGTAYHSGTLSRSFRRTSSVVRARSKSGTSAAYRARDSAREAGSSDE